MPERQPILRLRLMIVLLLLGCMVILSGCVTMTDLETSQENSQAVVQTLTRPGDSIEQTFHMRRSRLNSLTVWAGKSAVPQGVVDKTSLALLVELFRDSPSQGPVFSKQVAASSEGPLYIQLPPLNDPPGQAYRIRLTAPQGGLKILGANSDAYSQGSAFINNQQIQADIAFRTTYDYDALSALHDLANTLPGLWLIIPLAAVLLLPGWLLLDLSGLSGRFDPGERLALSLGLSLAFLPLVMLWTTTLGLHWNRTGVILAVIVLAAAAAWRLWKQRPRVHFGWTGLALAAIFLASLGVRLAMSRDLAGPAWVDSVHHAMITRLIELNGGFPSTYAPFVDTPADQYHSGFHSALATFEWLSGMQLQDGMLLFGNVLNALASLATYLFTTTLTRSRRAGVVAALISGLVTPMPAYYTSWGRYTELAGLLVLPAVLALSVQVLEGERSRPQIRSLLMAGVAFTGLLMVHYRVLAFLAILLAAYCISLIPFSQAGLVNLGKKAAWLGGVLVIGGFLLALPWIAPNLKRAVPYAMQSGGRPITKLFSDFTWSFLTSALGKYSLWAAGLGLAAAALRRQRFAVALVLWTAGMFGMASLAAFGLPGGTFINSTSVEISLFMPLALLGGYLVSQLWELVEKFIPGRFIPTAAGVFTVAGLAVALLGTQRLLPLLNPATELSRQGDRAAIQWIAANVPQDETILINPFQWMVSVYAGNDGGFWITPLSGHKTLPPPVIYAFGSSNNIQQINAVCQQVIQAGHSPDKLWGLMRDNNLHYVYSGVRGGPISVKDLASSPHFKQIYADQGAYIFQALP